MLRALAIFTFLVLSAENYAEQPFHGMWSTVFAPIGDLLFKGSPLKAPGVALALLLLLALARGKAAARYGRAAPLDRALWVNLGAIFALLLWGLLGGGSLQSAMIQIQVIAFVPVAAFLFIATLHTEEHFRTMGKVIVLAALYRATLVLFFYFFIAPTLEYVPPTMTTHSDTVLFATAIVALVSWSLEEREQKTIVRTVLIVAYLLLAVQLNNRRLAYVALAGSLVVLHLLLEASDFKRRVNRKLLMLAPIVALYLAVGWGSNSPVFAPAKSFSSMFGEKQDASSKTRDIENYNLIVTLRDQKIAGSGWGHGYNEVSVAYSVSDVFPIYRYVPHNTVLGLWAFSGYLGSTALWAVFLVATFLNVRAYRLADTPLGRTICATSVCVMVIYGFQAYGDMGIMAWNASFIVAIAFAAGSRMAVLFGAYPSNADAPA
jgi:hypothetical protein